MKMNIDTKFNALQKAIKENKHNETERIFKEIILLNPKNIEIRRNHAIFLARVKNSEESIQEFKNVLKLSKKQQDWFNLSLAQVQFKKYEDAVISFKKAIEIDPSFLTARLLLSETLRIIRNYPEAIENIHYVLNRDKRNADAFNILGSIYQDTNELYKSLECYESAKNLNPNNIEYRFNFINVLRLLEIYDIAIEEINKILELSPLLIKGLVIKAEILLAIHRYDDAVIEINKAIKIHPDNLELIERRALIKLEKGDIETAKSELESVLSKDQRRFMALSGLGRAMQVLGKNSEAESYLTKLIEYYQDDLLALSKIAHTKKFKPNDSQLESILKFEGKVSDNTDGSEDYYYALGKIYDDIGSWDKAFNNYEKANKILRSKFIFPKNNWIDKFNQLKEVYSEKATAIDFNYSSESTYPIFIVGMPRSGTTLAEQVISSHPSVVGGGEISFWDNISNKYIYSNKNIFELKDEDIKSIEKKYLDLLRSIAGDSDILHVTNKMPHDFMAIGIISQVFSNAKIIHCKRNPIDNCLSIFFQKFNKYHSYATDLDELAEHYRGYLDLMNFWESIFPNKIFTLNYEEMISDPITTTKKTINHLDIGWNDQCLTPHKLDRIVKTPSLWQVRQPIYNTSVARWKNYERFLPDSIIELGSY